MKLPLLTRKRARGWALALASALSFGTASQAQSLNYLPANASTLAGTFTSISTTGSAIATANTDNANSVAQNIGFTFGFNGATFTQFVLNTNGFVKLGSTAPSSASLYYTPETTLAGDVFSSTNAADVNIIAPFHADLESSGTTTATYQVLTSGSTGSRVCTIQWTNVRDKAMTNSPQYTNFSFQVKLYEGSNRIELVYGLPTAGTGADALRYAGAGLKGSGTSSGQYLLLTKTSSSAWSTATALNTNYTANALNYRQTVLPDAGRTFRFDPGAVNVPANDDPTGATTLAVGTTCSPTTDTNVGATTTTANGYANPANCGVAISPKDVWYKFTTQAGQTNALVTVTGNPAGLVRVFSASSSAGPFTEVNCSAGSTNNTVAPALSLSGLTPNTTYYISVAGYGSGDTQGSFTICVVNTTGLACAAVTGAAVTTAGGTATASTGTLTFTGPASASSYYLTLAPTAGGTPTTGTVTSSPVSLTGLVPNTSYTITITTNCSNGGASSPVTVVFTSAPAPAAPANDECAGAVTLTSAATCSPTNGTTLGATQSLAAIACGSYTGDADDDVWYKFVATATTHTVTVVGGTGFDAVIDVRSGTCANSSNIGCADATASAGTETVQLTSLTVGSTYYVRVYSYGTGAPGTFTICVTNPTSTGCAAVTGAAVTTAGGTATASTGTLTFTAASGATSYYLTLAPTAGGTAGTATVTSSPVNLTGLAPNTSYTITITTNCASGSTSVPVTVVFTSAPAPAAPANNECAGAITLTPAATCSATNGTTVGASQSLAAIACGGATGAADDDVWYKFVAAATTHTVTVVGGTGFDAVIDVRSGTCANSTNIGCADATGNGGTETTTLTGLTVGSTYYVRVYSYDNGTAGTFTICVTAPACPVPTNLAASNVTATGATLTFTAAAGAGSYTVTYMTQTGPAQTQTATGSPVTLTGLTPGTTYSASVANNCSGGLASSGSTITFTTLTTCAAPTNLAAGSITTTSATLTFTSASGASSYTVTYTPQGGNAQTQTATGSPVVLTGLTSGTQYTVSIVTNCGSSQTSLATTTTFTTLSPCTAVTGLATSNVTTTSATLTFTGASAGTSYTVTYTPQGGPAQTQTATGSPVTLANLAPGTTYTVSVVTSCGTQVSPGASITFTTLTPCTAVTGLTAGSITTTGATLTFTAPAAGATGYTVTYTPQGGPAQTQTATGSPVVLTGLTAGTQYTVSIVTSCGGGQTSAATTTTFTTLTPCTAVTGLAAGSIAATSAALTFTGASAGTSYTVTYTPQGGNAQTQTATGSPVTLANLAPGTTYTVSVVTNCTASQVSPAATTTFATLAPAPTGVTASNVTATGASISFTVPAGATSYTVTYTPAGGSPVTVTATASPVVLTGLTPSKAYTVSVVANYPGGGTSSAATATFTTPQGLAVRSTLAGGQLGLFPNPAQRSVTLTLPALGTTGTARVELLNALGQAVRQHTVGLTAGGTRTPLDLTGLASGVYVVRVQAGGETAATRLVIE